MIVPCLAYSPTLKMEATFSLKFRFIYNGLYGVFTQKIEHFKKFSVVLGHEIRHWTPFWANLADQELSCCFGTWSTPLSLILSQFSWSRTFLLFWDMKHATEPHSEPIQCHIHRLYFQGALHIILPLMSCSPSYLFSGFLGTKTLYHLHSILFHLLFNTPY
jgi:hypothetical protein